MPQTIEAHIAALTLAREANKQELFECEAQRLRNKEQYLIYGRRTDIATRLALEVRIKELEAVRQRSKVELMKLKAVARESSSASFVKCLIDALEAAGLGHAVEEARSQSANTMQQMGLSEAYMAGI